MPMHRTVRGFTLIEVILVLLLFGVVVAVAAVSLTDGMSSARVRSAGYDLVAALRYTRAQAIVTRRQQALELDIEARSYSAPKRDVVQRPRHVELRLLTAAEEQTGASSGRIRFWPDGSSTGGRIKLVYGAQAWDVEVAWLTGEVRLRPGEATP
ncbi:MAG: GspH/FimT family pseudopilin [Pseudomonadota bacterium]